MGFSVVWRAVLGVPRVWASDTATHFRNDVVPSASHYATVLVGGFRLGKWHRGTHDARLIRAFRAVLTERRCQVGKWSQAVPIVMPEMNISYRDRYNSAP